MARSTAGIRWDHRKDHADLEGRLQAFAADPAIALRDRVRIASAVGALMGAVMMVLVASEGDDGEAEQLAAELRATRRDILRPATIPAPVPSAPPAPAAPAPGLAARARTRRAPARSS